MSPWIRVSEDTFGTKTIMYSISPGFKVRHDTFFAEGTVSTMALSTKLKLMLRGICCIIYGSSRRHHTDLQQLYLNCLVRR
jgi:hypothetical protein